MNKLSVEECQRIKVQSLKGTLEGVLTLDINGAEVAISSSKCYFGGERKWFMCPCCSKRVGVLYRRPLSEYFLCRKCQNLTYRLTKYRRSSIEEHIKFLHKFSNNH